MSGTRRSGWVLYTYDVLHDGAWVRQQHLTGPMAGHHRPGLFNGPGYRNVQVRRLDPDCAADNALLAAANAT